MSLFIVNHPVKTLAAFFGASKIIPPNKSLYWFFFYIFIYLLFVFDVEEKLIKKKFE